jgi:hypothetical protein
MQKLARWIFFGALVSLLPLVFTYLDLNVRGQAVSLEKLIGNGELLVIVWVLSASAIGELIGSPDAQPMLKIVFGGLTFIVIIMAALFFSSIAELRATNAPKVDGEFIVTASIVLYLASLLPCSVCILSSAET